ILLNHHIERACQAIFNVFSCISANLGIFLVPAYVLTNIGFAASQIILYSSGELIGTPPPLILSPQSSPKFDCVSWELPIDKISNNFSFAKLFVHEINSFTFSNLLTEDEYGPT